MASNLRRTSGGRGADPERHARTDFRSCFETFGWLLMAMYIVGTPGNTVVRFFSMSFMIASISRGFGCITIAAEIVIGPRSAVVSPYTWKNGIALMNTSWPGASPGNHEMH